MPQKNGDPAVRSAVEEMVRAGVLSGFGAVGTFAVLVGFAATLAVVDQKENPANHREKPPQEIPCTAAGIVQTAHGNSQAGQEQTKLDNTNDGVRELFANRQDADKTNDETDDC